VGSELPDVTQTYPEGMTETTILASMVGRNRRIHCKPIVGASLTTVLTTDDLLELLRGALQRPP
jgi:hypothetical protein